MVGPSFDDRGRRQGVRRGSSSEGWFTGGSDGGLWSPVTPQYSRETTATLRGSARADSGTGSSLGPPSVHDVAKQRRLSGTPQLRSPEPKRPAHMQLFVISYDHGKDDDPSSIPEMRLFPPPPEDPLPLPRRRAHGHEAAVAAAALESAASTARANTATLRLAGDGWNPHAFLEGKSVPRPGDGGDTEDEGGRGTQADDAIPADEHPDAFANAMRLPVRIGQVFSVLPANAMSGSWSPGRATYAALVSGGLSILAALSTVMQFRKGRPSLVEFMVVVFYLMASTMSWLFLRMARHWSSLLRAFRAQERQHGVCPGLRHTVTLITSVLLSVAFVEHSLSEMNIVVNLRHMHPNASTFSEYLEIYVSANYPMVTSVIGYWPLLSPLLFFFNFSATFLWNFTDLFIMLLGVAVAARFKLLQESITNAIGNTVGIKAAGVPAPVLGRAYWRDARRSFNSLSKLAMLVDQVVNVQLFVSFLNNLYFICMQLLRGFDDPSLHWYDRVYVLFSFAFLVARTSAVSLLASSVHENSRSVRDVLYCVCSEDYSEEVYRFLVQVTSEMVALSGLNMFKVTRGLLLTVAGTILTYEVVLVQLH